MIRLLKYDWKRNAVFLLSALALFVILEIATELFIDNQEEALVLSFIGYFSAAVIIVVVTIRSYARNIISASRRMLPVGSLQHILSPLVMGLLGALILGLVFLFHYSVSGMFKSYPPFDALLDVNPGKMVLIAAASLEAAMFQLLIFFLAYTIGRSFHTKGRAAIMVISFLILQNGLDWLESALKLPQFGWIQYGLYNESNSSASVIPDILNSYSLGSLYGSTVFELIVSVIMIVVMVKLLDKRVETK
ncbi:hypothetical protein [Paenibacillus physcomitrellae]|uniref:ABC transporter permease n=1 Tax=Paenibacillus physcomitrellae TaxID=1619311 RepID=A0ABQ1GY07_9BACL|nr:hypothetical protein [Paenibacillus physcomitrellae]GGA52165.1 hypothetical protein GCM10010917_41760 [Paenibacillus physcomitrellae]